jgi:hypothetical protein
MDAEQRGAAYHTLDLQGRRSVLVAVKPPDSLLSLGDL